MNRENEAYKSFKVTEKDTCAELLPLVLRKYKVEDDWRQYSLFMLFAGREKCMSFEEHPLATYLAYKDQNPTIVVKHIKQVMQVSERPLPDPGTTRETKETETLRNKRKDYAVAIYEYTKERDDELNVAIGDQFQVVGHEGGWTSVLKEGNKYWVPSACLLDGDLEEDHTGERGRAIFDYKKNNANELTISKGDDLTIFRKLNHWLLAECKGEAGWVPSCYVRLQNEN